MAHTADILLEVRCPARVYDTLRAEGCDRVSLGRETQQALAARLYGERRLSLPEAAELARMQIAEFTGLLQSLGMQTASCRDIGPRQGTATTTATNPLVDLPVADTGIADLAEEHDHYAYGTRRRVENST